MSQAHHSHHHHHPHHAAHFLADSVHVLGLPISMYSHGLVQVLAAHAHLKTVHVTSVERKVDDQARIFYQKHVVEAKKASYKNPEVAKIIHHARELHKKGHKPQAVTAYLTRAIESVHGGPESISRHLGSSPFVEIFDIAHYGGPTNGATRHNFMSGDQAKSFLRACRAHMSFPITRLGHSAELGFVRSEEFTDEKCFHLEVAQPFFERVSTSTGTMTT